MINSFILSAKTSIINNEFYSLLFLIIGSLILYLIALKVIIPIVHYLIVKSPTKIDNAFMDRKVFRQLVLFPVLIFINYYSYLLPEQQVMINKIVSALFIWIIVMAFDRILLAAYDIYEKLPLAKGKPIKGYVQIIEIIVYLFAAITAISVLLGRSPWVLLSGLGAVTAVLMLVFKDTILSLVASVRISANRLIEIGDWIEMPQYGADGDVIDIALHNIQIQNWDKTIVTIPTHKLLEESFKNWKGIQLAGGRRIMRNIVIDIASIKFCDQKMLEKWEKIALLKEYLDTKKSEIAEHNRMLGISEDDYTNGRHLTNLGTFRAYISRYIRTHRQINQNLTILIRQLQPDATGIPIQVYAFTKTTAWGEYEDIQSDIFDHLLAIVSIFELRAFQYPSGRDLQRIGELNI